MDVGWAVVCVHVTVDAEYVRGNEGTVVSVTWMLDALLDVSMPQWMLNMWDGIRGTVVAQTWMLDILLSMLQQTFSVPEGVREWLYL